MLEKEFASQLSELSIEQLELLIHLLDQNRLLPNAPSQPNLFVVPVKDREKP